MVRSKFLLAVLVGSLIVFGSGSPALAAIAKTCTPIEVKLGTCSIGSIENGEAVIRGDQDNGGGGGNNGGGNNNDGGTGDGGNADGSDGPGGVDPGMMCTGGAICRPDLVTLGDLARFRPNAPTLTMEPDGWLLIGLPANFIAESSRHVQPGTLFDVPIEVRFTPASYQWSWGDGTSSRTSVPGATWAELGLPEFSTTPTSHVFAATGVYSVTVTVAFTVEYRAVGRSWMTIDGTVSAPAVTIAALAGDAKTVLVDKECNRNPNGPGC